MGSLQDSDAQIKPFEPNKNSSFTQSNTQLFDSQIFPGEKGVDAHAGQLVQNSVPFSDTVAVEDAFETQVIDLCDETQVLDDPDCFEHMETQVIDGLNSDGEETDKTEVLDDTNELSDGESLRRGKCDSLDVENTSLELTNNRLVEDLDENHISIAAPRFLSVRAASFRVSGLAARRKYLEGINSESSSLLTSNQHSEEDTVKDNGSKTWEEADQVSDEGRYTDEVKGLINRNSCKIGCPTMRKLFDEDFEIEGLASSSNKSVEDEEMLQLPAADDGLAGLSYIDSQEPGESSQANALACVQRLIEENKVLFDNEFDLGKSSKGKSNLISTAKGPQSLAKKANDRGTDRKTRIFDWDDGREDEGGGDIFRRRKEEFLGTRSLGQRSLSKSQMAKGNQLDGYRGNRGKSSVHNEKVVHSDSKIVLHGPKQNDKRAPEADLNIRKNLVNEFDEQSNKATSAGQPEAALTIKDMLEAPNIGLDTQMAAEAMAALFNGNGIPNSDGNDVPGNSEDFLKGSRGRKGKKSSHSKQQSFDKEYDIGVATRNSSKTKKICDKSSKQPSISYQKHSETFRIELDKDLVMTRSKRAKLDAEVLLTNRTNMVGKMPYKMAEKPIESCLLDDFDGCHGTALSGSFSVMKRKLPEEAALAPIAHRTRQALVTSQLRTAEMASSSFEKEMNCPMDVGAVRTTKAGKSVEAAKVLDAKGKSSELVSSQSGELEDLKSKLRTMSSGISCPRRRRSSWQLSVQLDEPCNLDAQSRPSNQPVKIEKSARMPKRSRSTAKFITLADLNTKRKTRSSSTACPDFPSIYPNFDGKSAGSIGTLGSRGASRNCSSSDGTKISKDQMAEKEVKLPDRQTNIFSSLSAEHELNSDNLLKEATEPSKSKCVSPVNFTTSVNAVSPVCIGDESLKRSCQKSLSRSCLMREISSLCATGREPISSPKESRRRRDLSNVRVMFSHHLDEDIIKQQRKIVERLKLATALSITDATHFITDEFVRTRNMLEAIASGKPVVTHLWLENVGRANYYIDEQKYILRDTKKEKEIGFNLPVSLAHACQHPLLEGRRVLITPKTKPGKDIISSLVKAVSGQAVERVGRSALKDDTIPDDLLILSCEEDYGVCVPFLEKGAAVYSSELLLNGIVIQKLEYERHQLFADHVKRTRSTIWLRKGSDRFIPVTKHK
ncbi:uncharacterized protein LOC8262372 isoform X1 [Ricinus communis]|uniref:uncharacterized protein LOC8262372 isoform X1 n=1 Tax=Ricinus communis TaxID=3988 RepID=UPI000772B37D|nr:uncharacterized protein LOC8262372 isoform X1 [Ricinus communis]|eukprot:XP_015573350.1 uncharacterized protein LOC8262372 isoform X1 [Ricinus communis]